MVLSTNDPVGSVPIGLSPEFRGRPTDVRKCQSPET